VLALGAAAFIRMTGSDPGSADLVDSPPATAGPPATAPPVSTRPTAPGSTRSVAEQDAAHRDAFVETMKHMGLTPAQAACAADRVQTTMGWSQLSEGLMDPGRPGQLEQLMVACMKA
jgi:hypothetical protein